MKKYFRPYRPFFIFLLKFFGVYAAMTIVYAFYLRRFDSVLTFEVDGLTQSVAHQVQWMLQILHYDCVLALHEHQASVKLILEGVYVSRVVEGCNGVSVMILFTSFVVAFSGKWKRTVGFILLGILIIHLLNVLRIALLSLALYLHPEYDDMLHSVVFPLCIYGVVFSLWVLWVNKFSGYAGKTL